MKLLNRVTKFIFKPRLLARLANKIRYPGLRLADEVNFDVRGNFKYGSGVCIAAGVNIIIAEGATLDIGDGCYIGRNAEVGPSGQIKIGSETSIQDRTILLGDVSLGRYCTVAPNVYISSGRHYYDLQPHSLIKDQDRLVAQDEKMSRAHSRPVVVEEDCWLGINAVVMSGVTIGKGAIIGANSVVTKNVAPYSVVGGVPAREIKKRLNFVPPSSIDSANPNDSPYFYSGFEVSREARDKYSAHGGVAARMEFELCLDNTAGDSIRLLIKNIGPQKCRLIFENQAREVSGQFQEVIFENNGQRGKLARMRMRPDDAAAVMIIQRAWIQ